MQLADIQEPPPPAGIALEMIIANLALALFILVYLLWRYHHKRNQWKRESLALIQHARRQPQPQALLELAKLLRRVLQFERHPCWHAQGDRWLDALDATFKTSWFSRGDGRVFGDDLYRSVSATSLSTEQLCNRLSELVRQHRVSHDSQFKDQSR